MASRGGFPRTAMNFHNQALLRATYQGARGQGFAVEFLSERSRIQLDAALADGAILIRESSVEAVVEATDETKQKMRTFLDSHFTGSEMHGNMHRRVSNAAVQSVYYDEVGDKGQFASLIYSKFGVGRGSTFVDYLLLHIRGGTLRPKQGDWLRIPNSEEGQPLRGQSGYYPMTNSEIFFARRKRDNKLFQLRRYRSSGKTVLLATLVKSLRIDPSLQGLEAILAARGAVFVRKFDAIFSRKKAEGRFV